MRVLGIEVDARLLDRWRDWLVPRAQPFFVDSPRSWPNSTRAVGSLTPELRDTFKTWKLDRSLKPLWLDEVSFFGLARDDRARLVRSQARRGRGAVPTVRGWADLLDPAVLRSQADGHRFVWWPSLVGDRAKEIVCRFVASGAGASHHLRVQRRTWQECERVVPGARRLAGSFPASSGPNCFGTVMAAAGVETAADEWMLHRPFLDWLESACRPGGDDGDPGTVLLWRDRDRLPTHAAVTIGDGWALEKPSQEWSTPRVVITVEDAIRVNRSPGQHLERHRILVRRHDR